MSAKKFLSALIRKKTMENEDSESKLERCLGAFDLTALGIGSTLGLGLYVLVGQVASSTAGPAVCISFLFAAIASLFAALCYAEFGARVPKAGSAYIYSYVTVGEFIAFVIGWNLILEYIIGTSSVARGYSGYIDSLFNGAIAKHFREWFPINFTAISPYPDFLAFTITIALTIMVAIGVKESTKFNSLFTAINLFVISYILICGSFKLDFYNWNIPKNEALSHKGGEGGFLPFGIAGVMSGAAKCFYGFVGFDVIAASAEEAKNPKRTVPLSIILSLLVIFLAYFGLSCVQTLIWPYYDQKGAAPLPYVFEQIGWPIAKYVVGVGALAGLSTSLFGSMFPLPRIIYAMAEDGLIFKKLATIHPKFKTPVNATILSGLFAATLAMIFSIEQLTEMMSIGTLLAYSLVALSVLILRYQVDEIEVVSSNVDVEDYFIDDDPFSLDSSQILKEMFNSNQIKKTTQMSYKISFILISVICFCMFCLNIMFKFVGFSNVYFAIPYSIVLIIMTILIVALIRQPQSEKRLAFRVPFLPLLPLVSVAINMYLMLQLSWLTWIRFAVWMYFGFLIYLLYGISNSRTRFQVK
ncbi:cationic amino acid transporter 2-like protein [Dinothrombium tinctorium]|uniref:Cationic amino acid transporter 2-like protein n=1 Tax=Dinothrombium tinctorium TaxID=1965070 RepID=A0A3S3RY54_9ACAR|nr:cationic amino acid transporter 2-like protein [Dinothrombium tinctorium]